MKPQVKSRCCGDERAEVYMVTKNTSGTLYVDSQCLKCNTTTSVPLKGYHTDVQIEIMTSDDVDTNLSGVPMPEKDKRLSTTISN